ncbi:hypothetical protein HOH45_08850 [bacterium]|nr:hypothetical protein [bacterium]
MQYQTLGESTYTWTNTLNYLEIPLLLKINVTKTVGFYTGGFASKLLNAKVRVNGPPDVDITALMQIKEDYGTIVGINYTVNPSFSLDLRLVQSQSSLNSDSDRFNQTVS